MDSRSRAVLGLISVIALVVRVAWILAIPDYDGDAYAHFEFATKTVTHPGDLRIHWIWLPGYHFILAALQVVHVSFREVRFMNAGLQAIGPFVLYRYALVRESPMTALTAAALWAVSSLGNLLGTSALAEVPFTFSLLAACLALDLGAKDARTYVHALVAGVLFIVAASMRYEAWFAIALLGLVWIASAVKTRRPDLRVGLAVTIPSIAILGYIVLRRSVDGEWLWFIRETYRFTHMQRGLSTSSPVFDFFWFPVILPLFVLGPAVSLIPLGVLAKRPGSTARRASTPIAIGLVAFLALTYIGRGALGQARYLTVLMPFACVAMARGCEIVAARFRRPLVNVSSLAVVSMLIVTLIYDGKTAYGAHQRREDLRAREERADGIAREAR